MRRNSSNSSFVTSSCKSGARFNAASIASSRFRIKAKIVGPLGGFPSGQIIFSIASRRLFILSNSTRALSLILFPFRLARSASKRIFIVCNRGCSIAGVLLQGTEPRRNFVQPLSCGPFLRKSQSEQARGQSGDRQECQFVGEAVPLTPFFDDRIVIFAGAGIQIFFLRSRVKKQVPAPLADRYDKNTGCKKSGVRNIWFKHRLSHQYRCSITYSNSSRFSSRRTCWRPGQIQD